MVVSTIAKPVGTAQFPKAAVEAKLRGALLDLVKTTAALHEIALPTDLAGQGAAVVHLDSLDVVDVLCGVDPIVGFPLKDSIVKSGGYNSIDEAVGQMIPRIDAAWQKRASKGGQK